jgi:hypothetical protein
MGAETKEWLATNGLAADEKSPIVGFGDPEAHDHKQDGQGREMRVSGMAQR